MEKMQYIDYPYTILVSENNPRMPIKKWVDRDENCQPIRPFKVNRELQRNVAIVLEELFVIDIDVGGNKNGAESFKKLIHSFGAEKVEKIKRDIADTFSLNTPSGGLHIYFLKPKDLTNVQRKVDFVPSVDLLTGKNTFVPAVGSYRPPTSEKAGGYYKRTPASKDYIAPAPQWLIELFTSEKMKLYEDKSTNQSYVSNFEQNEGNLPLDKVFNAIRHGFEEGSRNSEFTSLTGTLLNYFKYGKMSQDTMVWILDETAKKCSPPFPEKEWVAIFNALVKKEMKK